MPAAETTPAAAGQRSATPAQASLYQQLRGHLAALKMHDAAQALPAVLDAAAAEGLTLTAALERLFAIEVSATEARRLAGRLRFASLPTGATLEDFDYDAAPAADPKLIAELATCRYLESATNVLLIGPPGLGKTHLAVGLARKAAEAGYRTYFTTAADLTARCHRAAIEGPLGHHYALLQRARPPGHLPALPQDLHHLDQQPRRRKSALVPANMCEVMLKFHKFARPFA
jgi:DNA replication protein DnaC